MVVFNSELHLLTLIFCLLEFGMSCYQLICCLSYPNDKRRFWYLILLVLLIIYNIAGGLLPDPDIKLSLQTQNIIAYGCGFLMASYFPFYFYKAFSLHRLQFHAYYGVVLFLIVPYVVFFMIVYPLTGELGYATSYGLIIPAIYSLAVLHDLLKAIRSKINQKKGSLHPYKLLDMILAYTAMSPWVFMTAFAYFNIAQWIEVLVTNIGFVVITILFIARSIRSTRIEVLRNLALRNGSEVIFEHHCERFSLSRREKEIALLLCKGMSYRDIAEKLFISERTVDNHVQHIFSKTSVNKKMELQQRLGFVNLG